MPSFNANCLWNGKYVTVYCPTNNLWPASYVEELETNFGGRLTILAEDGSDPYVFEGEEKSTKPSTTPTEATSAPTTEPETQPETVETTVPETEETTVPTTEAEETETTEETTEPTEPAAKRTGGAVGIAIVVMVLSALGIGAILFYLKGSKGGKYAA